jgi:AAA domain
VATQPQPRSTGASSLEAGLERLIEPALYVVAGVLALLLAAPLLLPAAGLYAVLAVCRAPKGVCGALCGVTGAAVWIGAWKVSGAPTAATSWLLDGAAGYVLAGVFAVTDALAGRVVDWAGVARAELPGPAAVGLWLGGLAWATDAVARCTALLGGDATHAMQRRDLRLVPADVLARMRPQRDAETVSGIAATGRLTAFTALPKQGKTYAYFGLLKARQDGGEWFGRPCKPGRTLVVTEEDRGTFSGKVKEFGIQGQTLVTIHAPETDERWFGQDAWAAFLYRAAKRAKAERCDTLTLDTLTTWAPWAFDGPKQMSFCLRTLRAAVGRYKLAGVVIIHDRKAGGEAAVRSLGTIAGPAAYDVLAGFSREKKSGHCTLTVDGRLGEWERTAVLKDGRYVPVDEQSVDEQPGEEDDAPHVGDVPDGLKPALAVVASTGDAGAGLPAVAMAIGKSKAQTSRDLAALVAAGQLVREGAGASLVWRLASDATP